MSYRTNQSGFSAIEGLLIIVIVAIVGFTGYYVWHSAQNANKLTTVQSDTKTTVNSKSLTETQAWAVAAKMFQTYIDKAQGDTAAERLASVKSFFTPAAYQAALADDNNWASGGGAPRPNWDIITCDSIDNSLAAVPVINSTGTLKVGNTYSFNASTTYSDGTSGNYNNVTTVNVDSGLIVDKICPA